MEYLNITKELIAFKSTADRKTEIEGVLKYIDAFFSGTVKKKIFQKNGISTVLYYLQENPEMLLHGHVDVVVEQSLAMYKPVVKDGKLYARGANDMKSAVAVMMVLLKDLSSLDKPPSVGLLISTDEETGGYNGAAHVAQQLSPKFFLSGEPTGLEIGNQAKGVLQLRLSVQGKGAHSAKVWEGESAIVKMCRVIRKLEEMFPAKGSYFSTVNFGIIKGGEALNKVADHCSLEVDIRHLPAEKPDSIVTRIRKLGVGVEVLFQGSHAFCSEDDPHIKRLQNSLRKMNLVPKFLKKHAASDARHFTKQGIPAIVFGPKGHGSHAADEYVLIDSLQQYYEVLKDFCLNKIYIP